MLKKTQRVKIKNIHFGCGENNKQKQPQNGGWMESSWKTKKVWNGTQRKKVDEEKPLKVFQIKLLAKRIQLSVYYDGVIPVKIYLSTMARLFHILFFVSIFIFSLHWNRNVSIRTEHTEYKTPRWLFFFFIFTAIILEQY